MAIYAARYASALADVVLGSTGQNPENPDSSDKDVRACLSEAESQLNDFAAAWHESAGLREIFLDPTFPVERKVAILDKLNTRLKMSHFVRNFLAVLISHGRLDALDEIVADFRRERNRRLNIAEVEVISARKLDESEREALEARAAAMTGSAVCARFREDPALIGGVVLKIGDTVYDDSVRGRFDRLREQLAAD